jgi:stage V sporulation protein G
MEITEVRIKLMEESGDRLQAFCSITFDDCFVVRDLKIIEGSNGPFVAMPSRKLTSHCPQCGCKNHLRASYCNQCGLRLKDDRSLRDQEGRTKLYADIAHPINSKCREMIQERVILEFRQELERAAQPGYVSRYDDDYVADAGPEDVHLPAGEGARDRKQIQPPEPQPRPPHMGSGQSSDASKNSSGGNYSSERR